jgi:hypothetical protein
MQHRYRIAESPIYLVGGCGFTTPLRLAAWFQPYGAEDLSPQICHKFVSNQTNILDVGA